MKPRFSLVSAFVALGLVYACGAALRAGIPGMVFAELQETLNWSASQTALVSSVGVFGCMFFLPLAGSAIDRLGWQRIVLAGIVLQAVGGFLLSATPHALLMYGGAFLNGGGRTIVYLAIFKLLDTEFPRSRFSLLIGFFYLFSYGGTLGGSALFGANLFGDWQTLVRACSVAPLLLGFMVACLPGRPWRVVPINSPVQTAVYRPRHTAAFYRALFCTSFGIIVYWTFLSVGAKPYLTAFAGGDLRPLTVMNALVMIEMIGGGAVSYACGNHRTTFQFLGVGLILAGLLALACGGVWPGFLALGAGYGLTAIQLCALRDSVPPTYTARAVALANLLANIGIILTSQLLGLLYDCHARN